MSTEQDAILPMLQMRRKLELALEDHNRKGDALRKRLGAINSAIDVMRSSDDELSGILEELPEHKEVKKRKEYTKSNYDKRKIEDAVLDFAKDKQWFSVRDLFFSLASKGTNSSYGVLHTILDSGAFLKRGVRNTTEYSFNTDDKLKEELTASK
jgi:hypothetical protein